MHQDEQHEDHPPPGMANTTGPTETPGRGGMLVYDCPNPRCDQKGIQQGQQWCNDCDVALVWSGHPTDQPRVHPGDSADAPVRREVQLGAPDAAEAEQLTDKGDPRRDAIVTGIDGFPPRAPAEGEPKKVYEAPVGPGTVEAFPESKLAETVRLRGTPNAPPRGYGQAPSGFSDDVDPGSRPGAKNPASVASGAQEAEAPASALATPGSLPHPPKGEARLPPPMAASGRALEGATVPSLPDDPDPRAPLSGLRCSEIAAVAHTANVAYRQQVGDDGGPSWMQADDATRESCIAGVKAVLAGQINGPHVSHRAWYERKLAEGWEYGEVKSVAAKTHPNMAAKGVWGDLPETERRKDLLFLAIAVALIRAP